MAYTDGLPQRTRRLARKPFFSCVPSRCASARNLLQAMALSRPPLHAPPTWQLAEYEINLAGQRLIAVRHDPGEADLYPTGATVYVQLLRDNVYLLSEP